MEYKSSGNFIPKLYTDNFMIGSFDVYLDKSKELIEKNNSIIPELLDDMPTSLRASIVNKADNSYLGFISVVDMDNENNSTSLVLVLENTLEEDKIDEIVNTYKDFLYDDLGIIDIKEFLLVNGSYLTEERNDIITAEVLLSSSRLEEGIDSLEKEKLIEEGKDIPNLQMACTIKDGNQSIGLIGLTNLLWSNKRANLQVFIDKDKDEDFIKSAIPTVVDEYLDYVHNRNLYSISMSVSGSNIDMMDTILNSSMNFYASIPYASSYNGKVESNYLFQSYPNMRKDNGIYLPENKIITEKDLNKEFNSVINLGNGYIAMSPKVFEERNIDLTKIVGSHIDAMQERDKFTIPLGDDKFIIQEGNGKYGISKAVNNYTYIILDENMNYVGFTNILRENALNAEVEMALKPEYQSRGIGSSMRKKFYEELFRNGYMSVTSAVFDFNTKSKGLNEKFSKFDGKRIGAYYINGKLWDMNYYTKINEEEESGVKLR